MPAARSSSSEKNVIDSIACRRLDQYSSRSTAPGNRAAIPMTATSFSRSSALSAILPFLDRGDRSIALASRRALTQCLAPAPAARLTRLDRWVVLTRPVEVVRQRAHRRVLEHV